MIAIQNKFRNKLQVSNLLRLKMVNIKEVINRNRKQAHTSHTPHMCLRNNLKSVPVYPAGYVFL